MIQLRTSSLPPTPFTWHAAVPCECHTKKNVSNQRCVIYLQLIFNETVGVNSVDLSLNSDMHMGESNSAV